MNHYLKLLCCLTALFTCLGCLTPSVSFAGDKELLVESDEYKEDEFVKGVISDYSNMEKGEDIEWVWVDSGVKFSDYTIKISPFQNKSKLKKKSMVEGVNQAFKDTFDDMESKGKKGTLTTKNAIVMAELPNVNKLWIPFIGMNRAQAGLGVEMVFMNSKGAIVAKIRHQARKGIDIDTAAVDVATEIAKFVSEH